MGVFLGLIRSIRSKGATCSPILRCPGAGSTVAAIQRLLHPRAPDSLRRHIHPLLLGKGTGLAMDLLRSAPAILPLQTSELLCWTTTGPTVLHTLPSLALPMSFPHPNGAHSQQQYCLLPKGLAWGPPCIGIQCWFGIGGKGFPPAVEVPYGTFVTLVLRPYCWHWPDRIGLLNL